MQDMHIVWFCVLDNSHVMFTIIDTPLYWAVVASTISVCGQPFDQQVAYTLLNCINEFIKYSP